MASDQAARYLTSETGRRALFTIGALCLYRLGSQIPLPGLDFNLLGKLGASGSTLFRVSIFALGVTPIFTVMVVAEIAKSVCPPLARYEARGEAKAGRLYPVRRSRRRSASGFWNSARAGRRQRYRGGAWACL